MTTNFKPSLNARFADSRARARLFHIRREFVVMTKEAFLPLYLSLVHPILGYANQAISPYQQKDFDLTECLQKLATRLVKGLWHFPMSEGSKYWVYRRWSITDYAQTWSWCLTYSMAG